LAKALAFLGDLIRSTADARGDHVVKHAFGATAQQRFFVLSGRSLIDKL
jgi:hypothetical protein